MASNSCRIMLNVINSGLVVLVWLQKRACNASRMRLLWVVQRSFILYPSLFSDCNSCHTYCAVSVLSDFFSHARSFRLRAFELVSKWVIWLPAALCLLGQTIDP
jgi:hypothetical protein